jgi:hypothetical protein
MLVCPRKAGVFSEEESHQGRRRFSIRTPERRLLRLSGYIVSVVHSRGMRVFQRPKIPPACGRPSVMMRSQKSAPFDFQQKLSEEE